MCVDQVVEYGCNLTNHAFEVIWTNPPASKVQKSWNICFWYWRHNQIHVGIISDKVSLIQKYIFSLSKSNHVKWFQREERWTLSTAYWTPSSTTCQVQTLQTPVLAALRLMWIRYCQPWCHLRTQIIMISVIFFDNIIVNSSAPFTQLIRGEDIPEKNPMELLEVSDLIGGNEELNEVG